MNISEQIHLKLQLKENSEVEYKSAAGGFPKAEFWRSFSALANTNGGTIILGVKEKIINTRQTDFRKNLLRNIGNSFGMMHTISHV